MRLSAFATQCTADACRCFGEILDWVYQLNLRRWRISTLAGTLDQRLDVTRQPLNNFPTAVVQAGYGLPATIVALNRVVNRRTDELLSIWPSRLMFCVTSRIIRLRNLRRHAQQRSNGAVSRIKAASKAS